MKNFIWFVFFLTLSKISFGLDREAIEAELYLGSNFKKTGQTIVERIDELDKIQSEIDSELVMYPRDPELLLFKGEVIRAYAYTISDPFTEVELEELKSIENRANTWFLEVVENNHDDLTVEQLYQFKGYSSELAVYAIDEILASDHNLDDKDRVELIRNKIDHLIRLNQYDDAIAEMEQFNKDYPAFVSSEWDEAFIGLIGEAKERGPKDFTVEPEQNNMPDKLVAQKKQEAVVHIESENYVKMESFYKKPPKKTKDNMWLWIIGLVFIVSAGVVARRRGR